MAFQIRGRSTENNTTAVDKRVVGFSVGWGHWQETLATEGDPELLVTDGETGVRELARLYFPRARHQLCEWHVPYTLGRMLGKDGMEIDARRKITGKLSGILARGGPQARESYRKLTDSLSSYARAQTLLTNAQPYILYTPPSAERTTSVMGLEEGGLPGDSQRSAVRDRPGGEERSTSDFPLAHRTGIDPPC